MIKMYTKDKKWIVVDGERELAFDVSTDAWRYVFLMREIRPNTPKAPKSLYPVNSLVPRGRQKKVIVTFS